MEKEEEEEREKKSSVLTFVRRPERCVALYPQQKGDASVGRYVLSTYLRDVVVRSLVAIRTKRIQEFGKKATNICFSPTGGGRPRAESKKTPLPLFDGSNECERFSTRLKKIEKKKKKKSFVLRAGTTIICCKCV